MHYFLYSILLTILLISALPFLLWKHVSTPKYRGTIKQRFGFSLPELPNNNKQRIWIHAVSVGETIAAKGIVEKLLVEFPNHEIFLSTVTKTGQQVAKEKLNGLTATFYLPIDFQWIVKRVVDHIQPQFFVVMETELWPNLFHALQQKKIPVFTINGRLSPGSFKQYYRFRFFMAKFLQPVELFAMQSSMDAQRMAKIGGASKRIINTGNLKYDQALKTASLHEMEQLAEKIAKPSAPVWIAASTHPGEEEQVLAVYLRLLEKVPALKLILTPRHPERSDKIAKLIKNTGCGYVSITKIQGEWSEPILLVDQVGWLTRLYGYAQVAYVGGSLIPHGGQNILEPAAWSIPPVFGPHTFNFKDATQQILEADGGVKVEDENSLYNTMLDLLTYEEKRTVMGQNAFKVVKANTGALDRTVAAIVETINRGQPL
ncbi:MAG: 3-deoxy-D-manno-octulosonic acid transferase [Magnetococcales bacterium]|nr:3-deoxy-D-manno-octulosonic acid transferase [Magnetococcales bacterium]